jgi:hypothetical protein
MIMIIGARFRRKSRVSGGKQRYGCGELMTNRSFGSIARSPQAAEALPLLTRESMLESYQIREPSNGLRGLEHVVAQSLSSAVLCRVPYNEYS